MPDIVLGHIETSGKCDFNQQVPQYVFENNILSYFLIPHIFLYIVVQHIVLFHILCSTTYMTQNNIVVDTKYINWLMCKNINGLSDLILIIPILKISVCEDQEFPKSTKTPKKSPGTKTSVNHHETVMRLRPKVFWVMGHSLTTVIKFGFHHPRKKQERKALPTTPCSHWCWPTLTLQTEQHI